MKVKKMHLNNNSKFFIHNFRYITKKKYIKTISEIISTLFMIGLAIVLGVIVSWIISNFIITTLVTAEVTSISFTDIIVNPANSTISVIEIGITGGGITKISSVRVWHNDYGPITSICLDCSTLISPTYPLSRADTIYITTIVSSPRIFRNNDYIRIEIEYLVGEKIKKISSVFRI